MCVMFTGIKMLIRGIHNTILCEYRPFVQSVKMVQSFEFSSISRINSKRPSCTHWGARQSTSSRRKCMGEHLCQKPLYSYPVDAMHQNVANSSILLKCSLGPTKLTFVLSV